jgi:hypothetical protein
VCDCSRVGIFTSSEDGISSLLDNRLKIFQLPSFGIKSNVSKIFVNSLVRLHATRVSDTNNDSEGGFWVFYLPIHRAAICWEKKIMLIPHWRSLLRPESFQIHRTSCSTLQIMFCSRNILVIWEVGHMWFKARSGSATLVWLKVRMHIRVAQSSVMNHSLAESVRISVKYVAMYF